MWFQMPGVAELRDFGRYYLIMRADGVISGKVEGQEDPEILSDTSTATAIDRIKQLCSLMGGYDHDVAPSPGICDWLLFAPVGPTGQHRLVNLRKHSRFTLGQMSSGGLYQITTPYPFPLAYNMTEAQGLALMQSLTACTGAQALLWDSSPPPPPPPP